jgi:hypothetical protein
VRSDQTQTTDRRWRIDTVRFQIGNRRLVIFAPSFKGKGERRVWRNALQHRLWRRSYWIASNKIQRAS